MTRLVHSIGESAMKNAEPEKYTAKNIENLTNALNKKEENRKEHVTTNLKHLQNGKDKI